MKKLSLLLVLATLFVSCDYILKKRDESGSEVKTEKQVVLGTDKDAKGCVGSAGYRWSEIRKECIRVFEEGYRLNPINDETEEDVAFSAFVIFEENGNRAELFLPNKPKSILLKKEKGDIYANGPWSLESDKGYSLKKSGQLVYKGAPTEEKLVTGDDKQESSEN